MGRDISREYNGCNNDHNNDHVDSDNNDINALISEAKKFSQREELKNLDDINVSIDCTRFGVLFTKYDDSCDRDFELCGIICWMKYCLEELDSFEAAKKAFRSMKVNSSSDSMMSLFYEIKNKFETENSNCSLNNSKSLLRMLEKHIPWVQRIISFTINNMKEILNLSPSETFQIAY